MRWLQVVRLRIRALIRGDAVDRDLDDELQGHLQYLIDEFVAQGLSQREAHDKALREFGGVVKLTEECRDARGITWLTDLWRDVKYGVRLLGRAPAFTMTAVLTLALGIGANTAIFSLVNTVLLRLLPVDRPHDLVFVDAAGSEGRGGTPPYPFFERLRAEAPAFSAMAGFAGDQLRLEVAGTLEQVEGQIASGSYFDVLGLKPAAGRLLEMADEKLDPPVAVIGYGYWQRRFGGDPRAIGTRITFGGRVFTIVGVTPPDFWGLSPGRQVEVTLPITHARGMLTNLQTWSWYRIVARLGPGASVEQATVQADTIFQSFMSAAIQSAELTRRFARIELTPAARGADSLRTRFGRPLYALTVATALVLLIACVNLANLLLVRGAARTREFAIRLATGASAGRLLRQLLIETVLLFLIGALAGVFVAVLAIQQLTAFFAIGRNPIVLDVQYDWTLAAFAAAVAMLTAFATGLWPALRAARIDPHAAMKDSDGRVAGSRRATVSARALVAGQVSVSLVLVVGAVMFVKTMVNLRGVDLGFQPDRVLTMSLDPVVGANARLTREQFWTRALERVRALGGVQAASLSVLTPLSGRDTGKRITVAGFQPQSQADAAVRVNHVSEDYFRTFGIDLVAGRTFTRDDVTGRARVAMVNDAAEKAYFGGRSALGETLRLGDSEPYEVVGIVRTHKHRNLREEATRLAFVPLWQPVDPISRITLAVSSVEPAPIVARAIAEEIRGVYPNTLISDVIAVDEQIDATLVSESLLSTLASGFAVLAVGLAAIGLYGVLSYTVSRRRNEFGVRIALGEHPTHLASSVLLDIAPYVAIGIVVGLPTALVLARMAEAMLFGVGAADLSNYAGSTIALVLVAALAAAVPAHRAATTDPLSALRCE